MMNEATYNIAKEMYKNKKSLRTIAGELGINRKLLSIKLKEDGIKIKHGISDEDAKKAYKYVQKGNSITKAAQKYNVDRHTLNKRFKDLGLIDVDSKRDTTFDEIIMSMYNEGYSIEKISLEINKSTNYVWLCLRENNYEKNNYRQHSLNENIFEKIDSEEKAYWLGFLYADGYVRESGIELGLKESDLSHIEKFKKFIGTSVDIVYREKTKSYRLVVTSRKISNDLIKLGCIKNKSLKLKFPNRRQVNKKYIHHFMRGYFDGDGCIVISRPKNGAMPQRIIQVIGTKDFLDSYTQYFYDLGINKNKYTMCGKAYAYCCGGNIQVKKVYDFLYKDANIYLERKYCKFNCRLESKLQKAQDD